MAVVITNNTTDFSAAGATSYVTKSITPTASRLYLAAFTTRTGITADPNQPTLTGMGLTWHVIKSLVYDNTSSSRRRETLFWAYGSASTGALTLDCGGQAQTSFDLVFDEVAGMDVTAADGSSAIVQSATAFDGSATVSTITATLSAFNNANDATYGFSASGNASGTPTPGTGFSQLATITDGGLNAGDCRATTEWRNDNSTSVGMSLSATAEIGMIAVQIRAAVTGLVTKTSSISSPTSTGNQSYTGAGFQPKAVIIFATPLTADGSVAGVKQGIGFGLSSSSRAAAGAGAVDSTATVNSYDHGQSNAAVVYMTNGAGSLYLVADIVSMDADGITLNWGTVQASAIILNIVYLGGADLTNTFIKQFQCPASTGAQALTGVGFKPDAIMVITVPDSTTPPQHTAQGSTPRLSIGYGTSATAEASGNDYDDNGSTSLVAKKQAANIIECLSGNSGIHSEASLTSLDSDGFTLNWGTVSANDYMFALCLKGGQYKVGTETQKTTTGTKATTGVGFTPKGLMVQSVDNTASSSVVAGARFSLGAGNSSSSRGCVWTGNASGASTLNNSSNLDRANIIKMMTEAHGSPTTQAAADLTSFDSDGFTLNWGTADATAREFIYFAMGNAAAVTNTFVPRRPLMGVGL